MQKRRCLRFRLFEAPNFGMENSLRHTNQHRCYTPVVQARVHPTGTPISSEPPLGSLLSMSSLSCSAFLAQNITRLSSVTQSVNRSASAPPLVNCCGSGAAALNFRLNLFSKTFIVINQLGSSTTSFADINLVPPHHHYVEVTN